jgi:hypothetical protein
MLGDHQHAGAVRVDSELGFPDAVLAVRAGRFGEEGPLANGQVAGYERQLRRRRLVRTAVHVSGIYCPNYSLALLPVDDGKNVLESPRRLRGHYG